MLQPLSRTGSLPFASILFSLYASDLPYLACHYTRSTAASRLCRAWFSYHHLSAGLRLLLRRGFLATGACAGCAYRFYLSAASAALPRCLPPAYSGSYSAGPCMPAHLSCHAHCMPTRRAFAATLRLHCARRLHNCTAPGGYVLLRMLTATTPPRAFTAPCSTTLLLT